MEVKVQEKLNEIIKPSESATNHINVLNFYADWAAPCKHLNEVFDELANKYKSTNLSFYKMNAENFSDAAEQFEITAVPTFILQSKRTGKVLDKVQGANTLLLNELIEKHQSKIQLAIPKEETNQPDPSIALQKRLKTLTTSHPLMIFIKGTPSTPKCKFSRALIDLLNSSLPPHVGYASFNILSDEEVRAGLKEYSDWPTFPQVYLQGEFMGGLDIVKDMIESGEFLKLLPEETKDEEELTLEDRLKKLINKSKVMVFIKGVPGAPQCGFSNTLLQILDEQQVKYDYFNILTDEEVRSGLKVYSNWPTFPQVYVDGELIGGLDIIKEMVEMGEKIV